MQRSLLFQDFVQDVRIGLRSHERHATYTDRAVSFINGDTRMSITDGPFTETKEQLAGFYLLEAKDLDEAIAMAAKIPPAREGSIEIRPVRELEP